MRSKAVGAARRTIAIATVASLFVACYTQRPLGMAAVAPATRVVAQVTDTGAVVMANVIGLAATEVEGIVADADASRWRLHVVRVEHRGGNAVMWNREVVAFPRIALTNVRERRIDKKRSWIVAGLITAAIVTATVLFSSVLGGDESGGTPVPPA